MKLAVIIPTLPAYRKDFFESLDIQLQQYHIDLNVVHGTRFFSKSIKSDTDPKYSTTAIDTLEFKLFGFRIVWWRGIFLKLRELKPDIIIVLFNPGNISFWFIQIYCYLKKINIGIWSSGFVRNEITGLRKKIRKVFLNIFLKHSKFHICYGEKYKRELLALGIPESQIFVAQNTINIENILGLNIDRNTKVLTNEFNLLFVGALIKEKRLDITIKAVARLVHENYNIQFYIIGQGSIIDDLKLLVLSEKMGKNIFVLGPKYNEELSSYFMNADLFLLPGTGGLAINEAMAYGLPVISTVGDGTVSDLLIEAKNGYYLDTEASVENIYSTIKKALGNNKFTLREMGNLSRQIVQDRASLENMVFNFTRAVLYGLS